MKSRPLVVFAPLVGLLIAAFPLSGQVTLAGWETSNLDATLSNPVSATILESGMSSALLGVGAGLTPRPNNADFDGYGANGFATTGGTLAEAIGGNNYFSVVLDSGINSMSLDSVSFTLGGQNFASTRFAVFTDLTGFNEGDALFNPGTAIGAWTLYTLDLSSISAFDSITGSVEFRFYGYGTSGTKTIGFGYDGPAGSFNGTSNGVELDLAFVGAVIPEPSVYGALAGIVVLGMVWLRRRRHAGV